MKHRQIPPNLHFEEPNPAIPFNELPLRDPTEREPWPRRMQEPAGGREFVRLRWNQCARNAGGTGVQPLEGRDFEETRAAFLFPLSARSPRALEASPSRSANSPRMRQMSEPDSQTCSTALPTGEAITIIGSAIVAAPKRSWRERSKHTSRENRWRPWPPECCQ